MATAGLFKHRAMFSNAGRGTTPQFDVISPGQTLSSARRMGAFNPGQHPSVSVNGFPLMGEGFSSTDANEGTEPMTSPAGTVVLFKDAGANATYGRETDFAICNGQIAMVVRQSEKAMEEDFETRLARLKAPLGNQPGPCTHALFDIFMDGSLVTKDTIVQCVTVIQSDVTEIPSDTAMSYMTTSESGVGTVTIPDIPQIGTMLVQTAKSSDLWDALVTMDPYKPDCGSNVGRNGTDVSVFPVCVPKNHNTYAIVWVPVFDITASDAKKIKTILARDGWNQAPCMNNVFSLGQSVVGIDRHDTRLQIVHCSKMWNV